MRSKWLAVLSWVILVAAGWLSALAGDDRRPPGPSADAAPVEARFRAEVRPFLETYCIRCHGKEKPKGELDLSGFSTVDSVARDLARWDLVLEQIEAGTMPPAKAPRRPDASSRKGVIEWIGAVRRLEASRHAGDPGHVPARRLSNAEYDNTIRDLTGVDLHPTREFPVDPANEAGFDNSAESLAMSPALVKKYLEAARRVADHVVLRPDGLAFAPHPMLAETDRDRYCVNAVINFYRRQKTDLADYFLAAWRYRHREAFGRRDASLIALADEAGLSRKYLATIWSTLHDGPEPIGPIAALRALWNELPAPKAGSSDASLARPGCERMRDFVVELRGRLVPDVKNLHARGIGSGTQPFVLWKNRRMAANRMRYAGGGQKVGAAELHLTGASARALAFPASPEAAVCSERAFTRFCRTFPDAFYVSERARVYLDPKGEKGNKGRLLSAGFHSMTGYFRDDGPLYELMLDEAGRKELDRLWDEFDFITDVPMRQYASYLWFERAETGFLRGDPAFDFVRAEDRDAASEPKMHRFAEVYLAKARRLGASDEAIRAIEDQFRIIAATIRRVERERVEAEPRHIEELQRFAARAFRRPLTEPERRGIGEFYRTLRVSDGLSHEDAVRDSVVGILMSPHFCYRVDRVSDPVDEGSRVAVRPLSDYALASRLSYFLWASMPDDELLARAEAGDLHEPSVLASQARRMLRDPKVRGLAVEFGGNWLDFRRFEEHNSVDRTRFPTFNDELRRSMFEEPVRFLVDVARNDRPVAELIEAKHTFVNAALARHYGMPVPSTMAGSDGWVRVDDANRYGRGGLLPMAVFLTRNSPGLRTSPVKRGYWVVRRIIGETIPAPPPNVPDLPDDEAKLGDRTLRETLERHRADKACAGCHERFDSLGLAFEGYGPVGERRKVDLGGRPVDTRATFPRGGEGSGLEGIRAYVESVRRDEFVDNLCRKLLAYALGRSLIPSDDATVAAMRRRLDADGGRFGALVEAIVASPQFRNKRIETHTPESSR
ncbi:MAG: DUF1592 domain-containing protein [Isosphaeraceae bacterium]